MAESSSCLWDATGAFSCGTSEHFSQPLPKKNNTLKCSWCYTNKNQKNMSPQLDLNKCLVPEMQLAYNNNGKLKCKPLDNYGSMPQGGREVNGSCWNCKVVRSN